MGAFRENCKFFVFLHLCPQPHDFLRFLSSGVQGLHRPKYFFFAEVSEPIDLSRRSALS
jgi:hypothetical protein